jgi:hypothetical protein
MSLFDLPAPAPEPAAESESQPAGRQKCTDCRHWLTAPVPPERWVEGGCLGPKCAKGRGIKPAGSPRIAIRWRGPVEGQQDLTDQEEINEGEDQ